MTANDDVLHRLGLPRHPHPELIVLHLRRLADSLERHGRRAIATASVLADRGWPSGTLGDGGASNGASILVVDDETGPDGERVSVTSTEAAAFQRDRWHEVDRNLAMLLRLSWSTAVRLESVVADILAHADDADEVPAGTGACEACSKVMRPDARHPDRRLRAGLCDACRKHWDRSGITDRGDWLLARRAMLGHKEGADALAKRFTASLRTGQLGDTA